MYSNLTGNMTQDLIYKERGAISPFILVTQFTLCHDFSNYAVSPTVNTDEETQLHVSLRSVILNSDRSDGLTQVAENFGRLLPFFLWSPFMLPSSLLVPSRHREATQQYTCCRM